MSNLKVCRLCLNPNHLIDVFYSKTSCAGINHLRTCILQCTGTNILFEDKFPKYVCKPCCDVCLRIFEFRKQAQATERALKNFDQQEISANSNLLINNKQTNLNIQVPLSNTNKKQDPKHSQPSVLNTIKPHVDLVCGPPKQVNLANINPVVVLDSNWKYQ
nr:uncharacterized protein LOC111425121 [Onthophagus taurus]